MTDTDQCYVYEIPAPTAESGDDAVIVCLSVPEAMVGLSEYLAAREAAGEATVEVAFRRVRVRDFHWHCGECETPLQMKSGRYWCQECRADRYENRWAQYVPVTDEEAVFPVGPAMVEVDLPIPDPVLSPNARGHWSTKAAATRNQRDSAWKQARAAIGRETPPEWPRATVQIAVRYADARIRDKDNFEASLKSAFDGLQDAGLLENDEGLTSLPVEVLPPDKDATGVRLVLRRDG